MFVDKTFCEYVVACQQNSVNYHLWSKYDVLTVSSVSSHWFMDIVHEQADVATSVTLPQCIVAGFG